MASEQYDELTAPKKDHRPMARNKLAKPQTEAGRELRLKLDPSLAYYIRTHAAAAYRTFPAQAHIMLKFAASQMSAHDLQPTPPEEK